MEELPYGGDMNAAVRNHDRAAIRVLMEHREQGVAATSSAAAAAGTGTGTAARRRSGDTEPKISAADWAGPPRPDTQADKKTSIESAAADAAEIVAPVSPAASSGGLVVTLRVKFGKVMTEVPHRVADGVPALQQKLATLTRVPVASQTLVGPGGRKWFADSDLALLGIKDGMKVTLIGKLPPGWRAIDAAANALEPLIAEVDGLDAAAAKGMAGKMLEEQLTKHLLKLDTIDAAGEPEMRAARKTEVQRTQAVLTKLEGMIQAS